MPSVRHTSGSPRSQQCICDSPEHSPRQFKWHTHANKHTASFCAYLLPLSTLLINLNLDLQSLPPPHCRDDAIASDSLSVCVTTAKISPQQAAEYPVTSYGHWCSKDENTYWFGNSVTFTITLSAGIQSDFQMAYPLACKVIQMEHLLFWLTRENLNPGYFP